MAGVAESFADVTVLFADIVDFTLLSAQLAPEVLVAWLNELFAAFDALAETHGLEKIKTIADAYMGVGGLPTPRPDHAAAVANFALALQAESQRHRTPTGDSLRLRVGMDSGPVVAGVIGTRRFTYDLWGDTVNTASRMETQNLAQNPAILPGGYRSSSGKIGALARGGQPARHRRSSPQ